MRPKYLTRLESKIIVQIPKMEKGKYIIKQFARSRYKDCQAVAILWRDRAGREYWGTDIWDALILGEITIQTLRSKTHGVFVSKASNRSECNEGEVFRVEWRKSGEKGVTVFGARKYGSLETAEIEAHMFASQKRAELLRSKMKLPKNILFDTTHLLT